MYVHKTENVLELQSCNNDAPLAMTYSIILRGHRCICLINMTVHCRACAEQTMRNDSQWTLPRHRCIQRAKPQHL